MQTVAARLDRDRELEVGCTAQDFLRAIALRRARHRHTQSLCQEQGLPLIDRVLEHLGRRGREPRVALDDLAPFVQDDERRLDRRNNERGARLAHHAEDVGDESPWARERRRVAGLRHGEAGVKAEAARLRSARHHRYAGESETPNHGESLVLVRAGDEHCGKRGHGTGSNSRDINERVVAGRGPSLMPRRALSRAMRRTS